MLLALSSVTAFVASHDAAGGSIDRIDIAVTQPTEHWQGYYGTIDNASGPNPDTEKYPDDFDVDTGDEEKIGTVRSISIFESVFELYGGCILATDSLSSPVINNLEAGKLSEIDRITGNGLDSGTRTFVENTTFEIGDHTVDEAPTAFTCESGSPATHFRVGFLMDGNALVFVAPINLSHIGYDSGSYNFQFIVPTNTTNPKTYYMYYYPNSTIAPEPYGVTISQPANQTTYENVNATYLLTVTNTGSTADTYTLSVQNIDGATTAALNLTAMSLSGGASDVVALNVTNTAAGTFNVTVTATSSNADYTTGYIMTTVVAVTPTPTPVPGGVGGGGGGISMESSVNIALRESVEREIIAGRFVSYEFASYRYTEPGNDIMFVNFTPKATFDGVATSVEVLYNTSTRVNVTPPEIVYRNINLWVGLAGFATERNIENATVAFRVDRSWIDENSIDISTIRLYSYNKSDETWIPLPTVMTGRDDSYIYFESRTMMFGNLVIAGSSTEPARRYAVVPDLTVAPAVPGPADEPPVTPTATSIPKSSMIGLGIIAFTAMSGLAAWFMKRRIR